jgi:hypothetical protein
MKKGHQISRQWPKFCTLHGTFMSQRFCAVHCTFLSTSFSHYSANFSAEVFRGATRISQQQFFVVQSEFLSLDSDHHIKQHQKGHESGCSGPPVSKHLLENPDQGTVWIALVELLCGLLRGCWFRCFLKPILSRENTVANWVCVKHRKPCCVLLV